MASDDDDDVSVLVAGRTPLSFDEIVRISMKHSANCGSAHKIRKRNKHRLQIVCVGSACPYRITAHKDKNGAVNLSSKSDLLCLDHSGCGTVHRRRNYKSSLVVPDLTGSVAPDFDPARRGSARQLQQMAAQGGLKLGKRHAYKIAQEMRSGSGNGVIRDQDIDGCARALPVSDGAHADASCLAAAAHATPVNVAECDSKRHALLSGPLLIAPPSSLNVASGLRPTLTLNTSVGVTATKEVERTLSARHCTLHGVLT